MNETIKNYLQLMRAPAVFTALSNIFAAHLILTQGSFIWFDLWLLLGSTAALYSAGMILNDWFDYEVDCRQRPSRPLPSGRIQRQSALLLGSILLIAGVGLAATVGIVSFYLALGITLLVLLYNGLLKRTAVAGLVMGGCRYLNWLLGFSLLPLTLQTLVIPIPIFLYVMSLTLLSQQEESAQDKTVVLSTGAGVILAGLSIIGIIIFVRAAPGWETFIILPGIAFLSHRLWLCYRDFSPSSVQSAMQLLLFAIIPLDAVLVMVFAPAWWALAVLALLLPGRYLARFMYIT